MRALGNVQTLLVVTALVALMAPAPSAQTLPSAGVVFDDFDYDNAGWVNDVGDDPDLNAGSLFGWNLWARDIDELQPRYADRLWYRGYSWVEPVVNDDFYRIVDPSEFAGFENGGVVLRAPEGYCGPRDTSSQPTCASGNRAQVEINSGFLARRGVWAARINFSSVDDVLGVLQSFWVMSPYAAVIPDPIPSSSVQLNVKVWSEIDHEFNNNFDNTIGRGIFDATGYFEGDRGINYRAMHSNPFLYELGAAPDDYSCKFVVWGEGSENDFVRILPPATCASLFVGTGPQLVYGYPALSEDADVAVDLYISNEGSTTFFSAQAMWWGPNQNGDANDPRLHYFTMSTATGIPGGTSQPMSARFSQYILSGLGGNPGGFPTFELDFENSPLQQDHDMAVDWFFYSPDVTLDLNEVGGLVDAIRDADVCSHSAKGYGCRLNTLPDERTLNRPYDGSALTSDLTPRNLPAVYLEAPNSATQGQTVELVGSYAHRMGDLRLIWEYNLTPAATGIIPSTWTTVSEDTWFRQNVSFPSTGVTLCEDDGLSGLEGMRSARGGGGSLDEPVSICGINFRLRVGEYDPNAHASNWPSTSVTSYEASPVISYVYNGSAFVCTNCSAALPPLPLTESTGPVEAGRSAGEQFGTDARPGELPATFAFQLAYPNPTDGRLRLALALPRSGHVDVMVYDMLGRQVLRVSPEFEAGYVTLPLDLSHVASGRYAVRVSSGRDEATRQVTITR